MKISKIEDLAQIIYIVRSQKVIFDFDLAKLYGVENKGLKRQVRTNIKRFPTDFMFQLNRSEWEVVQKLHLLGKARFTNTLPYVFTEQGVAMLSSVLRSERAIEVNIAIMRAFVELRKFIINNEEVLKKIYDLENDVKLQFLEQDKKINYVFETLKKMMIDNSDEGDRKIGFNTDI